MFTIVYKAICLFFVKLRHFMMRTYFSKKNKNFYKKKLKSDIPQSDTPTVIAIRLQETLFLVLFYLLCFFFCLFLFIMYF